HGGVSFFFSNNNTIINNTADSNKNGLSIDWSSNNTLINNNVCSNTRYGIYLLKADSTTMTGNTMTNNTYSFCIGGYVDADYNLSIDTSNTINGKPMYYVVNAHDQIYNGSINAGFFACIFCDNVTVKDQSISNSGFGMFLY
ncbi:unnamed protein product, partial [marine sediment metagenome]